MKIIFELTLNHNLVVYIHTFTAVDNHILSEKLYTHSEYSTAWSHKLREWQEKHSTLKNKYDTWHTYETMVGHDTCITTLKFRLVKSVDDLIIDINTYLRNGDSLHKETGVYMVTYKNLKKDEEPVYDSAGYTEEDR